MIDNLTEAISHAKEVAKKNKNLAKTYESFKDYGNPKSSITSGHKRCLECASEHEQLAAWLTELQERREADKWVNAKEHKPEKDGAYLVVVEFQHILLVTYYDAENEHWGTANSVIAWRPLPEYKESEADK